MDQRELLKQVLLELSTIKSGMPNGELKQVIHSVKEIKDDVTELKKLLLNPEDGVIVKVNKNTDYRTVQETYTEENMKNTQDLQSLLSWKDNVTKALWIIFTAIIGISVKIIFFK